MEFGGIWAHPDHALVTACALCSLAALRVRGRRIRIRSGTRRPRPLPYRTASLAARGASLAALALALIPSPSIARGHTSVSPHRPTVDAAPPWSRANGFPPPRPLARAEATIATELGHAPFVPDSETYPSSHPAIHGRKGTRRQRLFPRAVDNTPVRSRTFGKQESLVSDLAESMRLHPAGKGLPANCGHEVQRGDTLWDISSQMLRSSDPKKVARLVDRLYEANRKTIADPDVIYPGQKIRTPDCKKRS
jgi:nucleoid-associated protein YgaU